MVMGQSISSEPKKQQGQRQYEIAVRVVGARAPDAKQANNRRPIAPGAGGNKKGPQADAEPTKSWRTGLDSIRQSEFRNGLRRIGGRARHIEDLSESECRE